MIAITINGQFKMQPATTASDTALGRDPGGRRLPATRAPTGSASSSAFLKFSWKRSMAWAARVASQGRPGGRRAEGAEEAGARGNDVCLLRARDRRRARGVGREERGGREGQLEAATASK